MPLFRPSCFLLVTPRVLEGLVHSTVCTLSIFSSKSSVFIKVVNFLVKSEMIFLFYILAKVNVDQKRKLHIYLEGEAKASA